MDCEWSYLSGKAIFFFTLGMLLMPLNFPFSLNVLYYKRLGNTKNT